MQDTLPRLLKAERQVLCRGLMPTGPHRHVHDEIILVERGCYRATVGQGVVSVAAGEAIWYPAGLVHEPQEPAGEETIVLAYLAFTCPAICRVTADQAVRVADRRGRLRSCLAWMVEACLLADATSQQTADALLVAVVDECRRLHRLAAGGDEEEEDLLKLATAFIEAHLADPLTVAEMADFTGWSRRRFERRFRARHGLSPKAWLRRLRIQTAVALLQSTGLGLAAIASRVGLRSVAHLSRAIRDATGRNPSAWR